MIEWIWRESAFRRSDVGCVIVASQHWAGGHNPFEIEELSMNVVRAAWRRKFFAGVIQNQDPIE